MKFLLFTGTKMFTKFLLEQNFGPMLMAQLFDLRKKTTEILKFRTDFLDHWQVMDDWSVTL